MVSDTFEPAVVLLQPRPTNFAATRFGRTNLPPLQHSSYPPNYAIFIAWVDISQISFTYSSVLITSSLLYLTVKNCQLRFKTASIFVGI